MSGPTYICMYMYIHVVLHIYIYVYIYRWVSRQKTDIYNILLTWVYDVTGVFDRLSLDILSQTRCVM
jgi:hypothetical protein